MVTIYSRNIKFFKINFEKVNENYIFQIFFSEFVRVSVIRGQLLDSRDETRGIDLILCTCIYIYIYIYIYMYTYIYIQYPASNCMVEKNSHIDRTIQYPLYIHRESTKFNKK